MSTITKRITNVALLGAVLIFAFTGAAQAHMHLVAMQSAVPQARWRDRLAPAAACVMVSGRRQGEADL